MRNHTMSASPAQSLSPRNLGAMLLLRRKDQRHEGATIAEIVEATAWASHSVRGFLAGAIKKKLGLAIGSEKNENRGRVYRITLGE